MVHSGWVTTHWSGFMTGPLRLSNMATSSRRTLGARRSHRKGHAGGGCRGKLIYRSKDDAVKSAAAYNDRVVIQARPKEAYWCWKHRAWHVGG